MRLGRGMCFLPQTMLVSQRLPADVLVPGSLALAGVGL
jgi:hypothetical protein